jgi:anaerobic ribonucleoside-triphosphate reductase
MKTEAWKAIKALALLESADPDKQINTTIVRKEIKRLEEKISKHSDEMDAEVRRNMKLGSIAESAVERAEEAETELMDGQPQNLRDEMSKALLDRLYQNLTLEQLDHMEKMAKDMVRNYKDF